MWGVYRWFEGGTVIGEVYIVFLGVYRGLGVVKWELLMVWCILVVIIVQGVRWREGEL